MVTILNGLLYLYSPPLVLYLCFVLLSHCYASVLYLSYSIFHRSYLISLNNDNSSFNLILCLRITAGSRRSRAKPLTALRPQSEMKSVKYVSFTAQFIKSNVFSYICNVGYYSKLWLKHMSTICII